MRFPRLLVLLLALCLGLLGQGHGRVLCQEACGCVAVETAHAPHAHARGTIAQAGACCVHHDGRTVVAGAECHDVALDVGCHVAPKPVTVPTLTRFVIGTLAWSSNARWRPNTQAAFGRRARGPPPPWAAGPPPQILACVRSVVRMI